MSKDIERLIKIQGAINRNMYHLHVSTNLEDNYKWILFLYNPNTKDYLSNYNRPILTSAVDSIDYLIDYLNKHDGFNKFFRY